MESKPKIRVGYVVACVLVFCLGAILVATSIFGKKSDSDPDTDTEKMTQEYVRPSENGEDSDRTNEIQSIPDEAEDEEDKIETFAIFGVDSRSNQLGEGTRSDSIMIVTVNHTRETVRVASIYRDTMLHISDYGFEKVTHAHAYGGPQLSLSTINENLDLNIQKYVTVNFINVGELIDQIGGIEMDITEEEAAAINGSIDEINGIRGTSSKHITKAGNYLLDGTQAVAYSRIRHATGGDYKRAERQRTVLFLVFEKAKTLKPEQSIALLNQMMSKVNTNFQAEDLTLMLYYLSDYEIEKMTAYPQVFYGGTVDGAWVEVPCSLVDMAEGMNRFLFPDKEYNPSETVKKYSGALAEKKDTPNNDFTSYFE